MATYIVGDIQGCYATFQRLLRRCDFQLGRDTLWLVGDLVNRGPRSLEVLQWVMAHPSAVTTVLGNHDLHLIAAAQGWAKPGPQDTLTEILTHPQGARLVDWLRRQPLLHRHGDGLLVHAGLLPPWTWERAQALARELEAVLQGQHAAELLQRVSAERLGPWREDAQGMDRLRLALAGLTRVRALSPSGVMNESFKAGPDQMPPRCFAWFDHPQRQAYPGTVYFGHWAALGFYRSQAAVGLDGGCVWGRSLLAYRREDGALFEEPAAE